MLPPSLKMLKDSLDHIEETSNVVDEFQKQLHNELKLLDKDVRFQSYLELTQQRVGPYNRISPAPGYCPTCGRRL